MFSMSLHELTACIYYKLAIDRGLRGCNPEGEKIAHAPHLSTIPYDRTAAGAVHTTNSYYGSNRSSASGSGGGAYAGGSQKSGTSNVDDGSKAEDYDCNAAHMDDIEKAIK